MELRRRSDDQVGTGRRPTSSSSSVHQPLHKLSSSSPTFKASFSLYVRGFKPLPSSNLRLPTQRRPLPSLRRLVPTLLRRRDSHSLSFASNTPTAPPSFPLDTPYSPTTNSTSNPSSSSPFRIPPPPPLVASLNPNHHFFPPCSSPPSNLPRLLARFSRLELALRLVKRRRGGGGQHFGRGGRIVRRRREH